MVYYLQSFFLFCTVRIQQKIIRYFSFSVNMWNLFFARAQAEKLLTSFATFATAFATFSTSTFATTSSTLVTTAFTATVHGASSSL